MTVHTDVPRGGRKGLPSRSARRARPRSNASLPPHTGAGRAFPPARLLPTGVGHRRCQRCPTPPSSTRTKAGLTPDTHDLSTSTVFTSCGSAAAADVGSWHRRGGGQPPPGGCSSPMSSVPTGQRTCSQPPTQMSTGQQRRARATSTTQPFIPRGHRKQHMTNHPQQSTRDERSGWRKPFCVAVAVLTLMTGPAAVGILTPNSPGRPASPPTEEPTPPAEHPGSDRQAPTGVACAPPDTAAFDPAPVSICDPAAPAATPGPATAATTAGPMVL